MKIYIVIEEEASEHGGNYETIIGAWLSESLAIKYAKSQNGGRYMNWRVDEVDVKDS